MIEWELHAYIYGRAVALGRIVRLGLPFFSLVSLTRVDGFLFRGSAGFPPRIGKQHVISGHSMWKA